MRDWELMMGKYIVVAAMLLLPGIALAQAPRQQQYVPPSELSESLREVFQLGFSAGQTVAIRDREAADKLKASDESHQWTLEHWVPKPAEVK